MNKNRKKWKEEYKIMDVVLYMCKENAYLNRKIYKLINLNHTLIDMGRIR